jgi:hypothetical protein
VKTFRFDATVLEPEGLPSEVRDAFRSAIEDAGAFDLRVRDNEQGRTTVSFRIDAENERDAMKQGSEITLSALSSHSAIRWVSSGVTYWHEG